MTTSPKPTKDEALKLARDALKELVAQNEISLFSPKNNAPCMTNSRAAIRAVSEALAQPAADDKAGGEAIAKLRRTEFGSGNNRRSATHIDALVPLDVLNAFPDGTYLYTHPHPQSDYDRGWNDGYKHGAWASKPQAEETIEQMAERLASKGWQAVVCGACGSEMAVGYPKPQAAQPAERVALTDEQVEQIIDEIYEWANYVEVDTAHMTLRKHTEQVFAAHGITAKDKS